ncbi:MAG: cupin domain-containing protein [Sideroxyarcus sp.]|nr:cupin domain-containing protein [Sideroxyarcus sp.]
MNTKLPLLGGLTVNEFLRDYWQKKPLLVRNAIPGFKGLLDPQQLIGLACRDDVQARLVTHQRKKWALRNEPFMPEDFEGLSRKGKWSVLVQGVNHFLPKGAELAQMFSFIPHARLDDLMVSYAPPGGGVGPHFDVYDVFLVQGLGHRRWQISTQEDQTLVEGAPLRLLKDFKMEQEWIVEAGDLLYLPPHCAHNGIAEDDCMTYSIGFRTPWYQELAEQFLVYLQDRIEIKGTYADPDLKAQKHSSEIGPDMLQQVARTIRKVKWDDEDVANFLGSYLSEPKPHIYFDSPAKPLTEARFAQAVQKSGVKLDLKTLMLCHGSSIFINGDAHQVGQGCYRTLRELADSRSLTASSKLTREAADLLYQWYLDGYVTPGAK